MSTRITDLRFIIGLFLVVLGAILALTHFWGPEDHVQGVALNLLGAIELGAVGALMVTLSIVHPPKA